MPEVVIFDGYMDEPGSLGVPPYIHPLPRAAFGRPQHVIGHNTVASIQSGVFWGTVAMVQGLVSRMKAEFDGPVRVVATGGLSSLICGEIEQIDEVDVNLTLEGLRLIWDKNRLVADGEDDRQR